MNFGERVNCSRELADWIHGYGITPLFRSREGNLKEVKNARVIRSGQLIKLEEGNQSTTFSCGCLSNKNLAYVVNALLPNGANSVLVSRANGKIKLTYYNSTPLYKKRWNF